jgi:RND family efflux transporter MFP subunit
MPTSRSLVIAVLGALAVSACSKPEPVADVVRPVLLARASTGGVADAAVFAGEVKPRHEADLAFRIGGKIVERRVDLGSRVQRGQPLARLDPADIALQMRSADAAVAAARTDDALARAEFERYENLERQRFVSASALDQKRAAMQAAAARLQQAQANLGVTRNQSAYATLVAPDDGVVTSIAAEAGQVVSAGQAVMRLARVDEREIAIAVPESRLDEVKSAQRVQVALPAVPGKLYAGRVREIAPAVDAATRTFAVRVSVVDADAALAWGMTANVAFAREGPRTSALVPLAAIYHEAHGNPAVWVYDAATQKVELRPVTIGAYRENGALVTSGLADGEWVVAAGANKLVAGQTVRPYEEPNRPAPPAAARLSNVVQATRG